MFAMSIVSLLPVFIAFSSVSAARQGIATTGIMTPRPRLLAGPSRREGAAVARNRHHRREPP
jgi:hypothetical protein